MSLFGTPPSSTPAFSFASPSPSAPSFGFSNANANATSTPSALSAPSFSFPSSSPPTTTASPFSSSLSLFTPQTQQQQQQQQLSFFTPSQPSPLQTPQQQQQQLSLFQPGALSLAPTTTALSASSIGAGGAAGSQLRLFTKQTNPGLPPQPASFGTRFEELHEESQKMLKQIEERLLASRATSEQLATNRRLQDRTDSSNSHRQFEADAARVSQAATSLSISMKVDQASSMKLLQEASQLLHDARIAVNTLLAVRHQMEPAAPPLLPAGTDATSTAAIYEAFRGTSVRPSPFLRATVERQQQQLQRQLDKVEELERLLLVRTRQQGVLGVAGRTAEADSLSGAAKLPEVMSNLHTFLIHVTAKIERVHESLQVVQATFLADLRRRGIATDPFAEAKRREKRTNSEPGSSDLVHPNLLPAGLVSASPLSLPPGATAAAAATLPTQAGLFGASAMGASTTPSLFSQSTPTALPSFSATPAPSLFGTPAASTPSAAPSLFGTPTTSPSFSSPFFTPAASAASQPSSAFGFGQQQTGSSLFGSAAPSSAAAPTTSLFGATPTSASPFGAAATPGSSLFGGATPSPAASSLFGATPGSAASPFSTPPQQPGGGLFGAPTSSFGGGFGAQASTPTSVSFTAPPPLAIPGASTSAAGTSLFGFGSATTTAKPKSRSGRRR